MTQQDRWIKLVMSAALGGLLLGCASPGTDGSGEAAAEAGSTPLAGKLEVVPDIALEDLEGNPVELSSFDGTVRLIDFWATWCAPCREEIPMFKELHEEYAPQGFTMVAVSMDDIGADEVRGFLEEFETPYVNLMGDGRIEQVFGPIMGYPMAFLIDRDGRVVDSYIGAKSRKVLEQRIRELLGLD